MAAKRGRVFISIDGSISSLDTRVSSNVPNKRTKSGNFLGDQQKKQSDNHTRASVITPQSAKTSFIASDGTISFASSMPTTRKTSEQQGGLIYSTSNPLPLCSAANIRSYDLEEDPFSSCFPSSYWFSNKSNSNITTTTNPSLFHKETNKYPETIYIASPNKLKSTHKGIKIDMEFLKNKGSLSVLMQFGNGNHEHIIWGIKTECTLLYHAVQNGILVLEGNIKEPYSNWDSSKGCYYTRIPSNTNKEEGKSSVFFIRILEVYH